MREPDARDAARVLALALLAMGAALLLTAAGLPQFVTGILQQAAFFGAPLLYARRAGQNPFAFCGFRPLTFRQTGLVLMASLGSLWLLYGIARVETEGIRVAGYERRAKAEEEQIAQGIEQARKESALGALVLLVLIPPFCEETFFRGILFRGLASRFGLGVALAATTILFAAAHGRIIQIGMMLPVGSYFAILVFLTGSLWSSVIAHAINNLAVLTTAWYFGLKVQEFDVPWWMYAASALVFGLAIAGLAVERQQRLTGGTGPATR
jgi:membrane protease YdiL (CAAX protease family)